MKSRAMLLIGSLLLTACTGSSAKPDATQTDEEYQAAMAAQHAEDSTAASGAEQQAAGTLETTGSMVDYSEIEGKTISGYLAKPTTGEVLGGVVLIHEWWGLNDQIKGMADKLASHGYAALAVDMYGAQASSPDEARALMTAAMERPELGVQNLATAGAYLANLNVGKLGVMGWCFGGMWTLEAGLSLPTMFDALVMYYGRVKTTEEEVAPLTKPLLGIFAGDDQGIPVDQVRAFEAALAAGNKDAQIHIYDGVDHAFANPTGDRYSADAANDAWQKTVAFFGEHLAK